MKSFMANPSNVEAKWFVVDAADKTLGRLAVEVAKVLRGKNKPTFTPHMDCGDHVIVINAEKIALTGNKWHDKEYFSHSGYLGGDKYVKARDMMNKFPCRMVEMAVKGMLPHNHLGAKIFNKLHVYAGAEHPHAAQKPEVMTIDVR